MDKGETLGHRVTRDLQDPWDQWDLWVMLGLRARLEDRENQAHQAPLDPPDLAGRGETLDLWDPQGPLVHLEKVDPEASLGYLDLLGNLA